MKNCLIVGSGRSGTSMLGGILSEAGYYMGENLYAGDEGNPRGFFENVEINRLNEEILSYYDTPHRPFSIDQRWLSAIPVDIKISNCPRHIEKRIIYETRPGIEPFCYKDPRFSYTLPIWNKLLSENLIYICVFRSPEITINSILKECSLKDYLADLYIDEKLGYEVWINMYEHILKFYNSYKKKVVFLHYDQIFNDQKLQYLSEVLKTPLNSKFVDKKLQRTKSYNAFIPEKAVHLYNTLCELAQYDDAISLQNKKNTVHVDSSYYQYLLTIKDDMIKQRSQLLFEQNLDKRKLNIVIKIINFFLPHNSIRRKFTVSFLKKFR